MMPTTSEFASAEEPVLMRAIQPQKGMKYACILDGQGNDIISFNEEYLDLGENEKRKLFMETALQAKMAQEFSEDLDECRCSVVERADGLKYVSVPLSPDNIAMAIIKNRDHSFFVNNVLATKECIERSLDHETDTDAEKPGRIN